MTNHIKGVPAGYRLVRIGKPRTNELFLTTIGTIREAPWNFNDGFVPIIEKIEPVCTWPKGVFANGWIAKDKNGSIWWYSSEPECGTAGWACKHRGSACAVQDQFLNPPVFKAGLDWKECVQQVGPEVENG